MDRLIEVEGITYRIASMLDVNNEVTNNPKEACVLLICNPTIPEGTKQPYWSISIIVGSLEHEAVN